LKWVVPERQKLIQFLQAQIDPAPTGKQLRRVLEANLCRVNGVVERFGTADVEKGWIVELSPTWQSLAQPMLGSFEVLHEDAHLLIVDKPAGWVCTDDECLKAFGAKRFLIHRLDKDTTGALLIAKSAEVRNQMIELFTERLVEKLYFALVDGIPSEERGSRKSFFAKVGAYQGQTRWGSRSRGLYAETHWKVVAKGNQAALLICQPLTGRTHQIRVHLAEIGHPILIDRQYADRFRCKIFAKRPMLHAGRLRFMHPVTKEQIDISAPLPEDFQQSLREVGAFYDGFPMRHLGDSAGKEKKQETREEGHDHEDREEVLQAAHVTHQSSQ
jgi:RluA family pseudouridine synthase